MCGWPFSLIKHLFRHDSFFLRLTQTAQFATSENIDEIIHILSAMNWKAAASLWHNLERKCGSLTCTGPSQVRWAFACTACLSQLTENPLSFPVSSYWATVPRQWHGQGYNSCIYCASGGASNVCPALFTCYCSICPHQLHSSSSQTNKCTCFLFQWWLGRMTFGPGICLVFSILLIVVTQGPLVLEWFVTNNPHNSHRLKDNSLII